MTQREKFKAILFKDGFKNYLSDIDTNEDRIFVKEGIRLYLTKEDMVMLIFLQIGKTINLPLNTMPLDLIISSINYAFDKELFPIYFRNKKLNELLKAV